MKSDYQKVDTNAKIKSVFIYNFTKYIEWPSEDQVGEFKIGILGKDIPLYTELEKMSKVKKVANRTFSIISFEGIAEIDQPHILYIPADNTELLKEAINKLKGKSTLIVTEKPGMAKQGSAINFVIVGNTQKFELNKANVSKHNLKVASLLENLAVIVN
ncbi:MAG: YfiR family protein [Bacteroidetes bacterium]|nr:YfiR family protein [Bacteroidota bacterium]